MTAQPLIAPMPTSKSRPSDCRRRSVRRPQIVEAWVRSPTDGDDAKMEVTAVDLSRHGVGFDSMTPLPTDCFYWIEIGIGDQRIACEIRVISCNALEDRPGVYHLGGEFC